MMGMAASGRKQPLRSSEVEWRLLTQSGRLMRLTNMRNKCRLFISRSVVVLAALVVVDGSPALACSCAYKGDFLDYANVSAGVIHARVVRFGGKLSHGETLYASMVVEVVSVVTGNLEFDSLVLMGDPGLLCREYVDSRNFGIGKEYLIALHGNEAVQSFGGCGEAWLAVNGEFVEGRSFTGDGYRIYSLPITEVLDNLKGK